MKMHARLILTVLLVAWGVSVAHGQHRRRFLDTTLGRILLAMDQQLEQSQGAGVDTNYIVPQKRRSLVYIGGYGYWHQYGLNTPTGAMQPTAMPGHMNTVGWPRYDLQMHSAKSELELGIDYKGFSLEYPIKLYSKYNRGWGLAKTGSVWGFRFRYRNTDNMEGTVDDGTGQQTMPIPAEWNHLRFLYTEAYYVFNHRRFSIAAGLYSDMLQKRSAGSPLVMVNYFRTRHDADALMFADHDRFLTNQVSLGAGYAYNFSLMHGRLVFHATAIPMFSIFSQMRHRAYDYALDYDQDIQRNRVFSGRARFGVNGFARFAANYSWDRYVLTLMANYRHYGYKGERGLGIRTDETSLQVNMGFRF